MDSEVSTLYEKSKDAIVKVHAEITPISGGLPLRAAHRVGTGFFIDDAGRLVTAGTLVEGATNTWIEWHDERVNARVLGHDPNTNLAVLQVDPEQCATGGQSLPKLNLGNSDELRIGSMVVAVGFPYELPSAPVVGFVGGLDIRCGSRVFPVSYIRAGCRLRPGQGGGPLLNARGDVVGVVVAAHADDQSYALPINAVKRILADIVEHGQVRYGWVGLSVAERPLTNAAGRVEQWQVFVQQVSPGTPSATAGFQEHDVLLRICTNNIRRSADVLNTMFYHRCGERLKMTVLRNAETQEVTVVVGQRPLTEPLTAQSPSPVKWPGAGLTIAPVAGTR